MAVIFRQLATIKSKKSHDLLGGWTLQFGDARQGVGDAQIGWEERVEDSQVDPQLITIPLWIDSGL